MKDGRASTRVVIIGNSGSGKSWLSQKLSRLLGIPAVDLDVIRWEPGGYTLRRDADLARQMVRAAAAEDAWIIEGVYGWLAEVALPRANALIWLDLDMEDCTANLMARGVRGGGGEAGFATLLAWAGEYRSRQGSNSFEGHRGLFETFAGSKQKLHSREDMEGFLALFSSG